MPFTIALPKGRLGEYAEELMIKSRIMPALIPKDSRKLVFTLDDSLKAILVRAWDVPAYVETGTADMGICGKDDLAEHDADVFEIMELGFGYCRMVVAAKNNRTLEQIYSRPLVRVATKYPNIAKKYFSGISIQAEIIKLYGSVELAAVTGMSDCIVDIVSTGATLKENGLCVLEELFESTSRLVVNRASYYKNLDYFNTFTGKLNKTINLLNI